MEYSCFAVVNGDTVSMFFTEVFGNCRGYLCIHVISGGKHTEEFFEYPEDVRVAQEFLRGNSTKKGVNTYFYPILFKTESTEHGSNGENVACAPVVCADLNMISPVLVSPTPDIIVESSPGRYQVYWLRNDLEHSGVTPFSVNGVVDTDFKLKRVPHTYNWKYHGEPWKVKLVDPDNLDTCDKVRKRYNLYGSSFELLFRRFDRWSLARLCGRVGADSQEVFLILKGAQESSGEVVSISTLYREALNAVSACKVPSLLSDEEIGTVNKGNGFVERYVSWASSCTDSPSQYHVACALTILSSLLCPNLRLGTSFGEFRPNLWFMILAGTTITRKTTSMRLAVRLLKEVHDDPILTTSGSPEGILTELSDRDGRSSLFYRDEITGLIEEMTKKDYLSGLMEALTKLYDGDEEKRTLRRQTIEVKDPNLVILSGGIKDKMAEILNTKHIGSGFLPRFLIVSGWSDVEDMKPIGPPVERADEQRENLIAELTRLYKHFSRRPSAGEVTTTNIFSAKGSRANVVNMSATDEAWDRIRRLEIDVREMGLASENPNIFGPIYERMMNSIIKVAMLIAADRIVRERNDYGYVDTDERSAITNSDSVVRNSGGSVSEKVTITLDDVVAAISYSDVWIESVYEIAHGIDDKPTDDERKVEAVENYILKSNGDGITRSELMRRFRFRAREMNDIEATLTQRGAVAIVTINDRKKVYRSSTVDVV